MRISFCWLFLLVCLPARLAGQAPATYWNAAPLAANRYAALPLGAVKPEGWLRRQLQIQANGLTGHLDEFWPDLGPESGWLGGANESWERGPYYVDGLVPLAYLLGDRALLAKASKWVTWTLEHQRADGGIGPEPGKGKYARDFQKTDWWPNMIMLKALTQYQEASGDVRVIPVMTRYFRHHLALAKERPLVQWAAFRWADEALSIIWLYNRTHDQDLLELARILHAQGFDWNGHFASFRQTAKVANRKEANLSTHGVNNAMAWKTPGVWWEIGGDKSGRDAVDRAIATLDRYHGQATGMFGADEHYAGSDPSQGTELCAVVEAMFSLEELLALYGDPAHGDRLERIAYNALPATFKPDMWAHQYDQQVNQIACTRLPHRNWTTNGPDANLFGLEPNFGCCTANMHQGWPKFVSHLWMAARGDGLAAVAYGPSRVDTTLHGVAVSIAEETDYPFDGKIRLTVNPASPAEFPLELRIPAWAAGTRLTAAGRRINDVKPGAFHTIHRRWRRGDVVEIEFPNTLRTERHYRNSLAVLRGPLLFSLRVGEDWRKAKGEEPHADWEVYPTTPWNYGLVVDPAHPAASITVEAKAPGAVPFSPDGAPVQLRAKAQRLPAWTVVNGSPGPMPESPVAAGLSETVTLIPYGSAKLRVTLFPAVAAR